MKAKCMHEEIYSIKTISGYKIFSDICSEALEFWSCWKAYLIMNSRFSCSTLKRFWLQFFFFCQLAFFKHCSLFISHFQSENQYMVNDELDCSLKISSLWNQLQEHVMICCYEVEKNELLTCLFHYNEQPVCSWNGQVTMNCLWKWWKTIDWKALMLILVKITESSNTL